jgi:hypothetical protein
MGMEEQVVKEEEAIKGPLAKVEVVKEAAIKGIQINY